MSKMLTNTVLMIEPVRFGFNELSAETNGFQERVHVLAPYQIQDIALLEFRNFVEILRKNGINVIVVQDTEEPHTPDSIFPNNWFSTCPNNKALYTYPMCNANRAVERREDIIQSISQKSKLSVDSSLVQHESGEQFLEGTGSLILDHDYQVAFAAISPRTHETVLDEWEEKTSYRTVRFKAYGPKKELIYHTNVLMCLADTYVVICMECIQEEDQNNVRNELTKLGKDILEISFDQMNQFAGNMLQLQSENGNKQLVMSSQAYRSLTKDQIQFIEEKHENYIIHAPLHLIETLGGGSARCMLAQIY